MGIVREVVACGACFVFFFQAEDGIRDKLVTGVQTCALPIYPGCLAACPRKAIYKRKEDGIVLIDQKRCRGYRKCVEQCPYKKPMFRGLTRVSEKCIACYPRIEGRDPITKGRPMETRCMTAFFCPHFF